MQWCSAAVTVVLLLLHITGPLGHTSGGCKSVICNRLEQALMSLTRRRRYPGIGNRQFRDPWIENSPLALQSLVIANTSMGRAPRIRLHGCFSQTELKR